MSITDYTVRPRSDGYRGYRIALTVGGERVQRYYRPEDRASAFADYAILLDQQRKLGTFRRRAGGSRHRNGFPAEAETGICGLRLAFTSSRGTPGLPVLSLGLLHEGRVVSRVRRVCPERPIAVGWDALTRELARLQGLRRRPAAWLAVPVPQAEQFARLAAVKRRAGRRINEAALSDLLAAEARAA